MGGPPKRDHVEVDEFLHIQSDEILYGTGLLGNSLAPDRGGIVREKFLIPPFSILDANTAWWRQRRKEWNRFGFESHLGRPKNMLKHSSAMQEFGQNDKDGNPIEGVFCPVLCELAYRWYCPKNGTILDPFSGGSVRGIVASILGNNYIGVDLRSEQVEENNRQAKRLELHPKYHVGDSRNFSEIVGDVEGDFIFSSPPYYYREKYSDLAEDLNNAKNYDEFKEGYFQAIASCCSRLREDRFACFEVNEVRDKKGIAPDFIGDTVQAFIDAGLSLYNHAIHAKPLGSAAIRTKIFSASRKLVPVHEHVLVFVKGDPKQAVAALEPL